MKMINEDKRQRGTIVCIRVVSYDEVSPCLKGRSIKEAVDFVLKSEQNEWKKTKSTMIAVPDRQEQKPNPEFFRDCFPKWSYVLNGKKYSPVEANAAGIVPLAVWDIELKVEYDPKLEAYRLLKKEKEENER